VGTRAYFQARLGHDFSRVRVHTDDVAARSARDLGADAYTVGDHVVFGAGRYEPGTDLGRRLLAHELTHVAQQQADGQRRIQRQPAADGIAIHIKIGDATHLDKAYTWHFDKKIPKALRDQLVAQIKQAFAFLPKEFPLSVDWGEFKTADLKRGGNIQVWLIPDSDPDLARQVLGRYGYSEKTIKHVIGEMSNVSENSAGQRLKAIGGTPQDTADTKQDPMTARPVIIPVPNELWMELDPAAEFKTAHPKATASRRIAQIGDVVLHEIGHDLNVGHAPGNIGEVSDKTAGHEQTFPPDIMDEVSPTKIGEFSDAPNLHLTKSELDKLGGAEKVSKISIVEKVTVDPKTQEADVWIDPRKVTYSKTEQDTIVGNLKLMVQFIKAQKEAKQKAGK